MTVTPAPPGAGDATVDAARARAAAMRSARARRTRRRLAIVAVVLTGAVGFLLDKALTSGIVYFKTVNQALAGRAALGNSTFQLEGVVAPRSLHAVGTRQTFALCAGHERLTVSNVGTPPQLFATGVAVVLVGHFVGTSDRFASDQILVKHSSTYVAAHPGRIQRGDDQTC